jgi:parvulin-like peptidyl-prolyl isomerase
MFRLRFLALPVLALAVALAAGCGGGGGKSASTNGSSEDVPANAVAVVAGTPILRSAYERLFDQAEAAYKDQGNTFPKAGTPEYAQLQQQAVDYLIQQVEFEKEAKTLGITVTDQEVTRRLGELKDQFFGGDESKYQAEIEKQGYTDADIRAQIRSQLISEKIFNEVTKDATVTDADVQKYYDEHKDQFTTPESREVAHILVDSKKLADDIYQQLQDGADFGALAKKYSTDTASAKGGGQLTDERGSFVPEFEKVAFALKTGEIGEPVKSQYGWHVIKALADTKPKTTTPFEQAKASIKEQLLQDKRNKLMDDWVKQLNQKFASQIAYAPGFQPTASTGAATSP